MEPLLFWLNHIPDIPLPSCALFPHKYIDFDEDKKSSIEDFCDRGYYIFEYNHFPTRKIELIGHRYTYILLNGDKYGEHSFAIYDTPYSRNLTRMAKKYKDLMLEIIKNKDRNFASFDLRLYQGTDSFHGAIFDKDGSRILVPIGTKQEIPDLGLPRDIQKAIAEFVGNAAVNALIYQYEKFIFSDG